MRKNMLNKLKRVMAGVMMACMLLTVVNVSSDAGAGVALCGEVPIDELRELG